MSKVSNESQYLTQGEETRALLDKYDTFLIDCDGVLWTAGELLKNTKELLEEMICKRKKQVFFITNNSTKSRVQYAEKFKNYGIDFVKPNMIHCSASISATYLKRNYEKTIKNLYVVGEQGLVDEMKEAGFQVPIHPEKHHNVDMDESVMKQIPQDELDQFDGVVIGWDRHFNFYKACYASLLLQQKTKDGTQRVKGFSTNRDKFDKVTSTRMIPGAGAMVAAVEDGAPAPTQTLGKPNPFIVQELIKTHNLDSSKMIMVGDRLDTDILLGIHANIDTLMVCSGVTTRKEAQSQENHIQPTYIVDGLYTLYSS